MILISVILIIISVVINIQSSAVNFPLTHLPLLEQFARTLGIIFGSIIIPGILTIIYFIFQAWSYGKKEKSKGLAFVEGLNIKKEILVFSMIYLIFTLVISFGVNRDDPYISPYDNLYLEYDLDY